ncbi:NeuD/PglB/VioB family sugar acetyltransferase [Micromonospora luteifusca]|uniref:NeuD/PglB/VioB family sugar acetyltransferase n=1 Tax=Micromonospora luteifusca TaxID=709860 RepID=UPI0033A270E8
MGTDLVIVGCGGHGREVLTIVQAVNNASTNGPTWRVRGFLDDAPSEVNLKRLRTLDAAYLGSVDVLATLPAETHVAIGIGDPRGREAVADRIEAYRRPAAVLVHPSATVGPDIIHGEGLLVFAGVRVTTNVAMGRHVHLNQNATIGHDCVLGDFVSVNPLAAVSGGCHVDSGALIGAGAVVLQQRHVATGATVGAAACVVRDVSPRTVVKGVPAQ